MYICKSSNQNYKFMLAAVNKNSWLKVLTCLISKLFLYFITCYTNALVQDCSNSIANAFELLQSCTAIDISFIWNVFPNPLAQLSVLLAPGNQVAEYV